MSANKNTEKISNYHNHQQGRVQCCQAALLNVNGAVINVLLLQCICCYYSGERIHLCALLEHCMQYFLQHDSTDKCLHIMAGFWVFIILFFTPDRKMFTRSQILFRCIVYNVFSNRKTLKSGAKCFHSECTPALQTCGLKGLDGNLFICSELLSLLRNRVAGVLKSHKCSYNVVECITVNSVSLGQKNRFFGSLQRLTQPLYYFYL